MVYPTRAEAKIAASDSEDSGRALWKDNGDKRFIGFLVGVTEVEVEMDD